MDHLWFHHVILFPEPTSVILSETLKPASLNLSLDEVEETPSPLEEKEDSSPIITQLVDAYNNGEEEKETNLKQRPTRLNLTRGRSNRSQSSSPATLNRLKKRHSKSFLLKSKSCRSLIEIELEEVKGFMDLGFRFNKEYLSPRMMSVLPGLQRVKLHQVARDGDDNDDDDDDETDQQDNEDYEKRVMRPYLSEAWLIRRHDSPLQHLRMPRIRLQLMI